MSSYHFLEETDTLSKSLRKHRKNESANTKGNQQEKMSQVLSNEQVDYCLKMSKVSGMILGCIVGCFLQSAVLGVCFVLSVKYSESEDGARLVAFLWCVVTGIAGVTICYVTRNLVWTVFVTANDYMSADENTQRSSERLMGKIITNVDNWFGSGCLVGMFLFWSITYTVLGMKEHVMQSFWSCLVSSVCWAVFIGIENESDDSDDKILDTPIIIENMDALEAKPAPQSRPKPCDPPAAETAVPLVVGLV